MALQDDRCRYKCYGTISDILLTGEQLRIQMHTDNPYLIKDRRYHFRTYNSVFTGSETVTWLLKVGHAPDRETAVFLMNILLNCNVFHHVCDSHQFKDGEYYYRFRKDDGTFPWPEDVAILLRGQRLFNRLSAERSSMLGRHELDGKTYDHCFTGCDMVDFLMESNDCGTREEAVLEGRKLLENDVIQHVTNSHHFKDEALLYQFKLDFGKKRQLLDLILPPEIEETKSSFGSKQSESEKERAPAVTIPAKGHTNRSGKHRAESGYHSGQSFCSSSDSSDDRDLVPRVLFRSATIEELQQPDSKFKKRHIRIMSDPVGFGFVIRGDGPVYIKTVDPTGPAAKAGLKVGHYIYNINDVCVLKMNHKEMAHVILDSMGYIDLTVMEHCQDN